LRPRAGRLFKSKFFQKAIAQRITAAIFTAPFDPKGTSGQHNPQSRELTTLRVQE